MPSAKRSSSAVASTLYSNSRGGYGTMGTSTTEGQTRSFPSGGSRRNDGGDVEERLLDDGTASLISTEGDDEGDDDDDEDDHSDELALEKKYGVDDREPWQKARRQGKASVMSSVSNLANTIIGSGALAFPSAFASMGWLPGMFSCAFSGATSGFGLYLLSRCARQVGRDDSKADASFNTVALLTFGQGWATRCFDAAIAIKCFGVSISYLIIVKTLMPQVVLSMSHHLPGETLPDHSMWLDGRLWLLLSFVIIGPISFLRRLDSLRFTSQIALASVVYLIVIVVGWWALGVPTGRPRGEVHVATFSSATLSSFPVQVFAYTCAQNLFPVFNELKFNNQRRMNRVIGSSIGSAVATYEVLGITGYLTFGSSVGSNVIAMYPFTSMIIAIGRLGIVLLVALSYPLQCHPCRACLHTLSTGWTKTQAEEGHLPLPQDEDEELPVHQASTTAATTAAPPSASNMSQTKFVGLTVGIILSGLAIALVIDELETVLSFVGSTGSTIISFILPGLFYFSLFKKEESKIKWAALTLAIYGVCVMLFCLSFNIYKLATHQKVTH